MRVTTMQKQSYEQKFGTPIAGGRQSEETLRVWEQVRNLPATEYVLLELEENEDLKKLRAAWSTRMRKMVADANVQFVVAVAINATGRHIVLWKQPRAEEPKKNAAAAGKR